MAQYAPCLNRNCKSHGQPHPNCRCYGPGGEHMADGGEVHFCSSDRDHNSDCEYFAGGGYIDPKDVEIVPGHDTENKKIDPKDVEIVGEAPADFINPKDIEIVPGPEKDTTEKVKAFVEGLGEGIAGPLSPYFEEKLGIAKKEDIARRRQDYSTEHGAGQITGFVGSTFTPIGLGSTLLKVGSAGAKAAEIARLGKVGQALIKSAVEAAAYQASDETSKYFLGVPGANPEKPFSSAMLNIGAASLMGGLGGSVFTLGEGVLGKATDSLKTKEVSLKIEKSLVEFAKKFEKGEFNLPEKAAKTIAAPVTTAITGAIGASGLPGAETAAGTMAVPLFNYIKKKIVPALEPYLGKDSKYVYDAVLKAIDNKSPEGIINAAHYARQAARAANKVSVGMGSLMKAEGAKIGDYISEESQKIGLDKFIEGGGITKQIENTNEVDPGGLGYAKGGEVTQQKDNSSEFSKIYPEQNILLNTAKGRIYNYLNGIRPLKNMPKKAFDKEPNTIQQKKEYDLALGIAVNPLKIIDKINDGRLKASDMKHFVAMYPESYNYLSQEMTKEITKAQLSGKKPTFSKRQSMSLFLGTELDSCFSPFAIQTIQGMYSAKKAGTQQSASKKQRAPSASSMKGVSKASSSYLTDEQAREKRMQNQK